MCYLITGSISIIKMRNLFYFDLWQFIYYVTCEFAINFLPRLYKISGSATACIVLLNEAFPRRWNAWYLLLIKDMGAHMIEFSKRITYFMICVLLALWQRMITIIFLYEDVFKFIYFLFYCVRLMFSQFLIFFS